MAFSVSFEEGGNPPDSSRVGVAGPPVRAPRHRFVAAAPGTQSPNSGTPKSSCPAPRPPPPRPPAGLRRGLHVPSPARPDSLSNAATATANSDSSDRDDWTASSEEEELGEVQAPANSAASRGAQHAQGLERGREETSSRESKTQGDVDASDNDDSDDDDSDRERSLSPFEPIDTMKAATSGALSCPLPTDVLETADERRSSSHSEQVGLDWKVESVRPGGGRREEFEKERDAMLTRLRKQQHDSGIALASMTQPQIQPGCGDTSSGSREASKAERRRVKIRAILADEERVKSLLRKYHNAERRMSEETVDAVLAMGACGDEEEDFVESVTEEDRARVRERLQELAQARMFQGHAFGMGSLSSENEVFDSRDVSDDDVHVHSLRSSVVVDTEAPHLIQHSRVRPGPGGGLPTHLFPWRVEAQQEAQSAARKEGSMDQKEEEKKDERGAGRREKTVRGSLQKLKGPGSKDASRKSTSSSDDDDDEDDDDDDSHEGDGKEGVGRSSGEGRAASQAGGISRRFSGLGSGLMGAVFKSKKGGSQGGIGTGAKGGEGEGGKEHEERLPRQVAQKALRDGFEMELPDKMMMGKMWKLTRNTGAIHTSASWKVRLLFLDEENHKILYCKDPCKRRLLRVTNGDKLQPHKIRMECITDVKHIKEGRLEGEPVPGACFDVSWKHPDHPAKTISLCAQTPKEAAQWVDVIDGFIHATRKHSIVVNAGTLSSTNGIGYIE